MATPYQRPLPKDPNGEVLQAYAAPFVATRRLVSENAAVSSVITLNDNTTAIEVTAVGATAALKWIPTASTNPSVIAVAGATANYDHIIPSGTMRRFVVPVEKAGISSVAGANIMNGLYQRVAYITNAAGSVLSSEF